VLFVFRGRSFIALSDIGDVGNTSLLNGHYSSPRVPVEESLCVVLDTRASTSELKLQKDSIFFSNSVSSPSRS